MLHQELFIEFDEPGWVVLRGRRTGETIDQAWLKLTVDFTPDDVAEALLATGWVQRNSGGDFVSQGKTCEELCHVVLEMFTYFARRNEPRETLLRVKDAVSQYDFAGDIVPAIPLWAFAWLDLMVRDDLADDARSTPDVWREHAPPLDAQEHRERRVAELVARYGGQKAAGRMAHSSPTRSGGADARFRAG